MKSRDEILKGLIHHSGQSGSSSPCDGCPYDDEEGGCSQRLTADAFSLLKTDEGNIVEFTKESEYLRNTVRQLFDDYKSLESALKEYENEMR